MIYFQALWLIALYVSLVNSNLYPQERCNNDDCSFQLKPFRNESCFMHKTEVCLQSMSNFTQKPKKVLESEKNAGFDAFIFPYLAEKVYYFPGFWNFSAVNISFVIRKEGMDALAMKIISPEKTICRIFDFRNSKGFLKLPVTLFYDCLYYPSNSELKNYKIEMISLPSNEHLTYYVHIPDSNSKTNPCDWRPVVMVFGGTLVDGIVKIKFSQAPQQLNTSLYSVELVEKSSDKRIILTTSPNKNGAMLTAKFVSVPRGNYAVIVKPSNENCSGTETVVFQVGNSNASHVLDIITVVCICIIILVIICSFTVYQFYILPRKLKVEKRTSNKGFEVLPDDFKDSSTRSSNEDNEDSGSNSSISDSNEDLKEEYEKGFI